MKNNIFICCLFLLALIVQTSNAQAYSGMQKGIEGAMVALVLVGGGLIFGLFFKILGGLFNKTKEGAKKVTQEGIKMIANIPEKLEKLKNEPDSEFYVLAEQEINNGNFDKGLWSKSLVGAKGNEDLRKSIYIGERAKHLQIMRIHEEESQKEKLIIREQELREYTVDELAMHADTYERHNIMYQIDEIEKAIIKGKVDKELWEAALINANGDEILRKYVYIKLLYFRIQS